MELATSQIQIRWILFLRSTGFLDFVHQLNSKYEKTQILESEFISILRWGEGDTYSVGSLRKSKPQSLVQWGPEENQTLAAKINKFNEEPLGIWISELRFSFVVQQPMIELQLLNLVF
jgi:hypothetical protein